MALGVPAIVAVPSPLFLKLRPGGRPPDSDSVGVGRPVVVTVKLPGDPTVKFAVSALAMDGAAATP